MPEQVSPREAEVLAAVGEHLSNAQIANRLHLSVRTVETHVSSLLRKLEAADRRALAALAPTLTAAPVAGVRGLPPAWTPFIGRSRERAAVRAALRESRLVTLLGPGGAGKTRLAAAAAEDLAGALPLGAAFVELVSVRPGFLVQAVAAVLGVTERPGQPLRDGVLDRLSHGRRLLVLDNCEHLIDDTAELLTALLGAASELIVLTTSRERIGIVGERVIPLGGLSLIGASSGGVAGSEAVALFVERAQALEPQFAADPVVIGELCAALDGMPLALELAATRTAALGVDGLLAGLDDRLRLLAGGRSADHRHRSLRAVLDWSYELLDDEEQRIFRRLAVFVGDFDLLAASAVTGIALGALTDLVGRLADKSLLVHRRGRWGLLETVRAYAIEKMIEAGEQDELRAAHLSWAAGRANELEQGLAAGNGWRTEFDLVVDDLRVALARASDNAAAHRLAHALGHLAYGRRFLAEARRHYVTAAERAADGAAAARELWLAADVAQAEARGTLRFELAVAAGERAAAAGDHATQAAVLAEAVSVAVRFPAIFDTDVPLEPLQDLLAQAERVAPPGDSSVDAQLSTARAWLQVRLAEIPDAQAFEAALAASRRADDPVLVSAALDALGGVTTMAGQLRETQRLSVQRAALLDRLPSHDPRAGAEIFDVLHMAVENAVTAGDLPAALAASLRFADEQAVASPAHMTTSKPLVPLALTGRFAQALTRGRQSRELWERAGCPAARWMAPAIYASALCLGLQGADAEADEWRAYARERVGGLQTRNVHFQLRGMATFVDARLALHRGELTAAARAIAEVPSAPDAWWSERHWYFDAYPWALAAEVAVVADLPDVERRLVAAQPVAEQNLWAGACLARARGRRTGSATDLAASVAGWERIDARFERACTLLLIADRVAEGRAELAALGVPLD